MQFIDEVELQVKAGNGGNGCISFHREKFIDRGGPDGGDGGRGGSIIIRSSSHLNTLANFRYKKYFQAENGQSGMKSNKSGKSGQDLILEVPVGTQIIFKQASNDEYYPKDLSYNSSELILFDFTTDDQSYEVVKGGKGGLGNTHFKSSTNQAPRRRTEGEEGVEFTISLKLKLISDVGIVGLPNAGKSTFLASVTNATPKIADYPFTTLSPNLGVVYIDHEEFVIADIPGLIEGAHQGLGLGDKFLKHIERCRIILHLIDASNENIVENYHIIRKELSSYSKILQDKLEIIALNKIELLTAEELEYKLKTLTDALKKSNNTQIGDIEDTQIFCISAYTKQGLQELLKKCLYLTRSI